MVPRNSTFCYYSSYVGDSYCALLGNINSSQCVVDQVAVKGSHPIIIFRTINWWKTAIIHYCCMTPPVPVRARSDRWSTMSFIQTSSSLISRRDLVIKISHRSYKIRDRHPIKQVVRRKSLLEFFRGARPHSPQAPRGGAAVILRVTRRVSSSSTPRGPRVSAPVVS